MKFKAGDVVKYEPDPFELVSWRDSKTGALVSGPPSCPMTVESVGEDGTYTFVWFHPGDSKLQRETFPAWNMRKVEG